MTSAGLYLHAVRAARPRQLRARLLRPLRRRVFPHDAPPQELSALPAAEPLWRSAAFGAGPSPDTTTRLGRFQAHYGEDVLAAARAGEPARARARIEAWIEGNPPRPGDAWHPYPLSTRVGNWIAATTLEPACGGTGVSHSLWRQLRYLERNVEDDILGNHLVRNARALVLGGAAFGCEPVLERGLGLLRRELPEQVLPDGGHYERSPAYHLLVLRDLLEVQAVAPRPWLGDAIERMTAFAAAVQRPDGGPPLFNDGWSDLVSRLELPEPPAGLTVLPESGLAVVRDGPLWLAFRCGPAAPPFLPAHAHADALSFQLWWHGEPLLVDAGTYTYEPGPDRDWFRGTEAHSTVRVDGLDQFRLWGAFRSGPLPRVELHRARDGELEASVGLPHGIRHVRRIEWSGAVVDVLDRLDGGGVHRVESRLLWAPGAREKVTLDAAGAPERLGTAWISERIGERIQTAASVVDVTEELPATLGWRLQLP